MQCSTVALKLKLVSYSTYCLYNSICYIGSYINYREKSIPMTALWCPAFSNHG